MKTLFIHAGVLVGAIAILANRTELFGPDLASAIMAGIAGWQIGAWSWRLGTWIEDKLR